MTSSFSKKIQFLRRLSLLTAVALGFSSLLIFNSAFAENSYDDYSVMTTKECELLLTEANRFGNGFLATEINFDKNIKATLVSTLNAIMRVSGRSTLMIREKNFRTVNGGTNYIELIGFPRTNGQATRSLRIEVSATAEGDPTYRIEKDALVLTVPKQFKFEILADGGRAIIQRYLRGHPLHPSITSGFGTIMGRESLGEPAVFLKAAQMQSLRVVRESMNRGDPAIGLIGPTGTGKTPIMAGMLDWRLENNRRKIIVVEASNEAEASAIEIQLRTSFPSTAELPYKSVKLLPGEAVLDAIIADALSSSQPVVLIATAATLEGQLNAGARMLRATRKERFKDLLNEFNWNGARKELSPIDHLTHRLKQVSAKLHILANDQTAITTQLYNEMGALDPLRTKFTWIQWGGDFGSESISELVSQIERSTKPVILISTIQSLRDRIQNVDEKSLKKLRSMLSTFAFDEVHHLGARTYRAVVDELARHADSPSYFYGTTATPEHPEYQDFLNSVFNGNAFWTHLDSPEDYLNNVGNSLNRNIDYVTRQYEAAETNGDLVPFDEFALYDTSALETSGQPFFISANTIEANSKSSRKVVNPYYYPFVANAISAKAEIRKRGIVFANTIEETKNIERIMNKYYTNGGIKPGDKRFRRFAALHSGLSSTAQTEILDQYRSGKIDYLVTVNMVNEGIDIPQAACIFNLSNSLNARGEVQKLGRIVRNAIGKFSADYVGFFRVDDDNNVDDDNLFFINWINMRTFPARTRQSIRLNSVTSDGNADTTVFSQLHSGETIRALRMRLLQRSFDRRRRANHVESNANAMTPTPGSQAIRETTQATAPVQELAADDASDLTAVADTLREFFQVRHAKNNRRLPTRMGSDDEQRLYRDMTRLLKNSAAAEQFYEKVVNGDEHDHVPLPSWSVDLLQRFRHSLRGS